MNNIPNKLLSGRLMLAYTAGVAFLILVVSYAVHGPEYSISGEAIVAIIASVVNAYFGKARLNGKDA